MDESLGWISLHRKIVDNPIWKSEPFSKGQAWVDILLLANHKDNTIFIGNKVILCKRGQLVRSYSSLSKRWKWGIKKIRLFLELLSKTGNLDTIGVGVATQITICNYDKYQDVGRDKGTIGHNSGHDRGTIRATNNNVNNENNENKNTIPPTWKTDFNIYKNDLRSARDSLLSDTSWVQRQESDFPNIDLIKSLDRSLFEYWGLEQTWKIQRKKKTNSPRMREWLSRNLGKNKVYR